MARRYLFGPVSGHFSDQNLHRERQNGRCLAFGFDEGVDVVIGPADTWESLCARLPADWQPDFVVLYLQYRAIPPWLWSAPLPLVALAGDWNLQWHSYRRQLRYYDFVLTDALGAETMAHEGMQHVCPAILFGGERAFLEWQWADAARDIDILLVGNFQPAVQRERLAWMGRLACLGERWNVLLATAVYGEQYRSLLARTRIVFNRGIRGEWNLRVTEALAAGALLFQEDGNLEVGPLLTDRQECVYYNDENLESLLQYYLEHEDERQQIAAAGHARVQEFSFDRFWQQQLGVIDQEWESIVERSKQRPTADEMDRLLTRAWQAYPTTSAADPALIADLGKFVESHPEAAPAHHALGYVHTVLHPKGRPESASVALPFFASAWKINDQHVMACLNLAEVHVDLGQNAEAIRYAQQALETLEKFQNLAPQLLDSAHYPGDFDYFRVEWERAAWQNAGQLAKAKRDLLRWRLHVLLADLLDDLTHFEQAAQIRPDLPISQAAHGCALARRGRFADAVEPLQRSLALNPFDQAAARALFAVYQQLGRTAEERQMIHARRLLHKAAPQIIPVEPWFQIVNFQSVALEEFERRYGRHDFSRAVHGFTIPRDAHVVLTLVAHAMPKRILEIGTAAGHMTANFSEWSPDDAHVYTIGVIADLGIATSAEQRRDDPPRSEFARFANAFGKVHKVFFITADSLRYDFQRLAPLDFVFIDGAHDLEHVLADSRNAFQALKPGGWLVWHDFDSATPWVKVREALEQLPFAQSICYVVGTEVAYFQKPGGAAIRTSAQTTATTRATLPARRDEQPLAIVWEGDQKALHSLSLVNREFCRGLIERGHDVSILADNRPADSDLPLPTGLAERLLQPLNRPADVHIRQQWPPSFAPPASGHWVMMQPWEFGSLPKEWVGPMKELVDELWVNTRYVEQVYLQSGIPPDRVHLVPLGVDTTLFHPGVAPLPLMTTKRFKFLFVGGTIFRKGIDVLLDAYAAAFRKSDDVCLVIKDMGVGTFYQGQTAEKRIAAMQADPDAPETEYIDRALSQGELAGLYSACSCLAHPYRGEGFGLPIVEAMASGLAVIVTGMGAALDFCNESNAYLIPAQRANFSKNQVGDLETVDTPWLAEPDRAALGKLLRHIYEHPDEARTRGALASAHVGRDFTWSRAALVAESRLRALQRKPIRRQAARAPAPKQSEAFAPDVSLCMIVRNEEKMLPDCLRSIAGIFGEIVIADTGSTDRTKEIAASFGAKVVDFQWIDSFAAARNESLRHATGKWILWLDADERLDEPNRQRLKQLLANLGDENTGYLMRQSSRLEHGPQAQTHVDQVRLFPNHRALRWEYRVHEQILPNLRAFGTQVCPTDIVINHIGFEAPALQGPKVERNLRLLLLEIAERPDDTFVLYNLGAVAITQNRVAEAIGYFERCLALSEPGDHMLAKVHALIARGHQQSGKIPEALAACRRGRQAFGHDPELLFLEAVLLHQQNDLSGAERCLVQLLELPRNVSFAGADSGLQTYRPRLFLTEIYRAQGRLADAESMLRAVVAECPSMASVWRQLAEIYFEQSRWQELTDAVDHLRYDPQENLQGSFLLAQAHLARKEFAQARSLLNGVIARAPGALEPKIRLARALLNEGKDWPAAEAILREILAIDPNHREAQHNLQALQNLQKQPRPTVPPAPARSTADQLRPLQPEIPTIQPAKKRSRKKQRVSLCMIVKNEENNLGACLESVGDLVDEKIIVDTGSTDRTKEIAASFGAKVYDFPWIDHFAAARNESLKHATCEWIFWMDADDRLDAENQAKLRALFESLDDDNAGYVMKCLCLPDPVTQISTEVDHMRLFRNRADIRWKYRVHEQILPAVKQTGGEVRWSDVVVHHTGYLNPVVRQGKLQRDLRILLLDQSENPDDAFILFNLGAIYQEQQRPHEALRVLWRSVELSATSDSIVRKLYVMIAQCYNELQEPHKALTAIRQGLSIYLDDIELFFQEGVAHRYLGDTHSAIRAWERILTIPQGTYFASINPGIRNYLTHKNLAVAYIDLGMYAQSEAHWRKTIEKCPEYLLGWIGWSEFLLTMNRIDEVAEVARNLEKLPGGALDAALLDGRVLLSRKQFDAAREVFQKLQAEHPNSIQPRRFLSYVYLQEGKDWDAAEQVLRDILALEPNHAETRNNLKVLLQQQGRAG